MGFEPLSCSPEVVAFRLVLGAALSSLLRGTLIAKPDGFVPPALLGSALLAVVALVVACR